MRVLQIINSLATGGAEKLILERVPLFIKQGVKMDVAVLNGAHHPFMEGLKASNCCTIFSLSNKSVYNPFLIFKIIPYLKKYDIVHVHIFPSLYWVALAKALSFSNITLVYTEHSTSNHRRKNRFFKIVDKLIYRFYSKIITISPEVDLNIKKHLKYKPTKFELIQNGVNLETIERAKPICRLQLIPNIPDTSHILIQVASFRYPKDQKTVIRALKHLDEHVFLVLVGDGPLKKECEALVETLNLSHRVIFLGIRMDVINLLKGSDIIILSSHHEGLSLSCIEGMASGKPFIATDAPGLGTIVKDAGILFPINDHKTLSTEINKLLNNKTHYQAVVSKCLERANTYNITHTIDKEIALYKSVIPS